MYSILCSFNDRYFVCVYFKWMVVMCGIQGGSNPLVVGPLADQLRGCWHNSSPYSGYPIYDIAFVHITWIRESGFTFGAICCRLRSMGL